jgi:hypothetical protein
MIPLPQSGWFTFCADPCCILFYDKLRKGMTTITMQQSAGGLAKTEISSIGV